MRALLRLLALLAVLTIFIFLDWYPTVKDLGRLRQERRDLERKIKDYGNLAGNFEFPSAAESSLLAGIDADLRRALPEADNDDAWAAISVLDLQSRVREDSIPHARFLFPWQIQGLELGTASMAGEDPLSRWVGLESENIQAGFALAYAPGSFPWRKIFSGPESRSGRLACRQVCVAALAPLPEMLGFINRLSWGETRLEIVRLRLEPAKPLAKAWVVCRGLYRIAAPSKWRVKIGHGKDGENLLVDPDSPLLLQKADPLLAPRIEKKELPPAGGPR